MHLQTGLPSVEFLLALPPARALTLVLSLDGQICGPDGSSRSISAEEDLDWLRRLRASSEVVVVGAATAAAEGYGAIRIRPAFAAARAAAGLAPEPELLVLRRGDDAPALLRDRGRILLEAGVRLHTALAPLTDRIWISHAPVLVGDTGSSFALPLEGFALAGRWRGDQYAVSRFERVSPR